MSTDTGIKDIARPPRALCDALAAIGTATLSSELAQKFGIRDVHIKGPRPRWCPAAAPPDRH